MDKEKTKNNRNITDIDLSVTQKKRFRIDGDDDRILELNTSDMNILVRLRDTYPKFQELVNKLDTFDTVSTETEGESDVDELIALGNSVEEIDTEMRKLVDYIFDADVSAKCATDGSMYDVFNGEFRFEHIINVLVGLYEENITQEYKKMSKRIQKHTDKYIKK